MLWNWYTIDSCFLSESWHIASNGAFAASCIGTILLVMTMEALRRLGKEYDDWVLRGFQAQAAAVNSAAAAAAAAAASSTVTQTTTTTTVTSLPIKNGSSGGGGGRGLLRTTNAMMATEGGLRTVVFRASPLQQLIRSFIHAISLGLAYIVMLLVMSFNGYIIICVIIGAGLGKFFCDWMTRPMVIDFGGAATGIEEPTVCC